MKIEELLADTAARCADAEAKLALAREGLEKILKVKQPVFNGEKVWSTSLTTSVEQQITKQTLAKLSETK